MYLYNSWEETGDESVECRALRKFLRQIELHKTGQVEALQYRVVAANESTKTSKCKPKKSLSRG